MQTEEETDVCFVIEAKNRVTADRAIKALFKNATNIKRYDGVCIR